LDLNLPNSFTVWVILNRSSYLDPSLPSFMKFFKLSYW
jgi:hypothetical protein